jgi:hypothetical protein
MYSVKRLPGGRRRKASQRKTEHLRRGVTDLLRSGETPTGRQAKDREPYISTFLLKAFVRRVKRRIIRMVRFQGIFDLTDDMTELELQSKANRAHAA